MVSVGKRVDVLVVIVNSLVFGAGVGLDVGAEVGFVVGAVVGFGVEEVGKRVGTLVEGSFVSTLVSPKVGEGVVVVESSEEESQSPPSNTPLTLNSGQFAQTSASHIWSPIHFVTQRERQPSVSGCCVTTWPIVMFPSPLTVSDSLWSKPVTNSSQKVCPATAMEPPCHPSPYESEH